MHASDAELQQQAQACQVYVDVMEATMPYECALVKRDSWVEANLFALTA